MVVGRIILFRCQDIANLPLRCFNLEHPAHQS